MMVQDFTLSSRLLLLSKQSYGTMMKLWSGNTSQSSNISILDSEVSNNQARSDCGGLFFEGTSSTIERVLIKRNIMWNNY